MDSSNNEEVQPSSLLVNQSTLDFLAILCDELGDKEAAIRAYHRLTRGERIEHGCVTPRTKMYEGESFASEMGSRAVETEREKEASFDPARQIKVVDEQGRVRILYKSWASEVARKAREDEDKRSTLGGSSC